MAVCLPLNRTSSRRNFLSEDSNGDSNGDRGVVEELGQNESSASFTMPKKLFRSVSLKLRRLNLKFDESDEDARTHAVSREGQWASGKCLGLYGKSGRCRVGADVGEDIVGGSHMPRKAVYDDCLDLVRHNADREGACGREFHGCLALDGGFERLRGWNRKDSKWIKMCKSIDKKATDMIVADASVMSSVDGEENWTKKRERVPLECFAYGRTNKLWRRNSKKSAERNSVMNIKEDRHVSIPDDIIEMCLARASFASLVNARLVCKKWRMLTASAHFMQMRAACLSQKPWLFLFGLSKDGVCVGQIQALDINTDKWHRIDADILRGRFMFSVAGAGSSIYVVGGCSSSNNSGRIDKSSYKTHKAVLLYSPLIGSWKKIAPMKTARASPVVGVFEFHSGTKGHSLCSRRQGISSLEEDEHGEERDNKSRLSRIQGRYGGVASCSTSKYSESRWNRCSEVYGGLQKASGRQYLWEILQETTMSEYQESLTCTSTPEMGKLDEEEKNQYRLKERKSFGLIVVGGQGKWNEPLDSAEIYDPVSDQWREIVRLPPDHGIICAGVFCNGTFYVYSESDKLAAYDFEKGYWVGIQITHSPVRLLEYVPKLVSCKGRLFMLCVSWCVREDRESRQGKATRKLWELDYSSYSWTEVAKHPDAPLDWNASFVGSGDQIYAIEMFKIFGQVLDFVTVCDVSGPNVKWSRISREHVAQDMDASSCMTKSAVVVQL